MSDREIVEIIKNHIRHQDKLLKRDGKDGFKMRDPLTGKRMLKADEIIKRLDKDKRFRKIMIKVVVKQTAELLPGSELLPR